MSSTEKLLAMTDKERLIQYGYEPHHILEMEDGTATLDLEMIRKERIIKPLQEKMDRLSILARN